MYARKRAPVSALARRVRARVVDRSVNRILAARRSVYTRIPRPLIGRVQTSGFYGRYNGPDSTRELKFFDTVEPASAVAIAGSIINASLNIVPQDDTQSGRIGRKIVIKKIQMRGQLLLPATTVAADTSDKIRIVMVLDSQTNGAAVAVATITETADINSYLNMANSSRFRVLYDKFHTLTASAGGAPTATPSFGAVLKHYAFFKKCNIPIEYDASAATGAVTTQRTNNLVVFGFTLNNKITNACTYRIRYDDA